MKLAILLLFLAYTSISHAAITNLYKQNTNIKLQLYLSDFPVFQKDKFLVWEKTLPYNPDGYVPVKDLIDVPLTKHMMNNGTIYGHLVSSRTDVPGDTLIHTYSQLNIYLPRKTVRPARYLLTEPYIEEKGPKEEIISFWKSKINLHIVPDFNRYANVSMIPPIAARYMRIQKDSFVPILYLNRENVLDQVILPVNATTPNMTLEITFDFLSVEQFDWFKQLEATWLTYQSFSSEKEIEDMKKMFLETSQSLLYITSGVAFFHLLFDFLAFKNDVSFWKNAKTLEGLSIRAVFMNIISQFIILLYLYDNETNKLVLGSVFVGLVIEIWKVLRVGKVVFRNGVPTFEMSKQFDNAATSEYDAMAFKYVGMLVLPVVFGYSFYSLVWERHTGWYSWFLGSLVAVVYSLGFVRMTPQLFINYKMKSVAHLPWRAFTYKALNTFIDDLFAFIIKMPTMHRLSCFRDDMVFLVYLYQLWAYPVDKSRVNEYGGSESDGQDHKDKKERKKVQ